MIMKTIWKVAISSIALLWVFLSISSVSAYRWGWYARTTHTIVDVNDNWIADWLEDFDLDWVLNRDDSDFERTYVNIRDDDWDWIANRYDSDYVRPLDGNRRWNWRWR